MNLLKLTLLAPLVLVATACSQSSGGGGGAAPASPNGSLKASARSFTQNALAKKRLRSLNALKRTIESVTRIR